MLNCVECGAPIGDAGDSCGACGAQTASGPINGTHRPRLEDPDGLVYEDSPLLRDDLEHDPRSHERADPRFVRAPLRDDPSVEVPAFASAPPVALAEPRPAPFFSRAIALAIDLVILSFLNGTLYVLARNAVLLAERVTGARVGEAVNLVQDSVSAGAMTLLVGYFSVLHARSGQTLGKVAMRIHVVDADGGRISIARSVLRTLAYALSALPFGAGFLLALGPAHRALHDRIADTQVLRLGNDA
jgi:uncharacterized RDD family membrane protein YckC